MVGTPSSAALNRHLCADQGTACCADLVYGRVTPLGSFELLQDFLTGKQFHFYCQTERTFTRELRAALLDKGKDTQVA